MPGSRGERGKEGRGIGKRSHEREEEAEERPDWKGSQDWGVRLGQKPREVISGFNPDWRPGLRGPPQPCPGIFRVGFSLGSLRPPNLCPLQALPARN